MAVIGNRPGTDQCTCRSGRPPRGRHLLQKLSPIARAVLLGGGIRLDQGPIVHARCRWRKCRLILHQVLKAATMNHEPIGYGHWNRLTTRARCFTVPGSTITPTLSSFPTRLFQQGVVYADLG